MSFMSCYSLCCVIIHNGLILSILLRNQSFFRFFGVKIAYHTVGQIPLICHQMNSLLENLQPLTVLVANVACMGTEGRLDQSARIE